MTSTLKGKVLQANENIADTCILLFLFYLGLCLRVYGGEPETLKNFDCLNYGYCIEIIVSEKEKFR